MDQDLIDLIAACRGGELDPSRCEHLLERLRRDDAFRRSAVAEIRMLGMLKAVQSTEPRWLLLQEALGWGTGTRTDEEGLEKEFLQRVRGIRPHRWAGPRGWWAAAAAATILVAGLGLGLGVRFWPKERRGAPDSSRPSSTTARDGLAMVLKLDGVRWESEGGPAPAEGDVVGARRLRLRSGLATLAFFSGVALTMEGPADVDLVNGDRVYCRRGKLRARVPQGAEGFVIAAPGSAVVDLGTEFGMNVGDDGKAKVMVFEGLAEAALLDASGSAQRTQTVVQSRAFELDSLAGRIAESAAEPRGFVEARAVAAPPLVLDPGYAEAVLRSRPRAYWRFGSLLDGGVSNEVPGGPPLRVHGPIGLSDGSEGNGCAVFKAGAPEQFLDTDGVLDLARVPGHAVELWFWSEGFHYASLVGLFPEPAPPDPYSKDAHVLLLEITARERQSLHKPASVRYLQRWPIDLRVGDNLCSEAVYAPRRWHHVVAQKAGDRMELYFNGAPSRSRQLVPDHPGVSSQLVVGRRTRDADDPKDSRSFVGRLDELALYDHPLSAEEIRRHYALATPKARP